MRQSSSSSSGDNNNNNEAAKKTRQKQCHNNHDDDPTYMDESVWGALPVEVQDRVLASLPFPFLFRMRCVCKRWCCLLADPAQFLKAHAELVAPGLAAKNVINLCPAVCFLSDRNYREGFWWAAFDFGRYRWQIMPSLPPQLFCRNKHQLYGGGGGLFCLWTSSSSSPSPSSPSSCKDLVVDHHHHHQHHHQHPHHHHHHHVKVLSICNPITAQWRDLPPLVHKWGDPVIRQMIVDFSTNSYKMILAGNQNYEVEDEGYRITEVYDSALGSWKKGGKFLPSLYLPSPLGAFCDGHLFFLASRPMSYVYNVLIGYDIERDVWMEIPHVLPKQIQGIPYVFECEGNLWMMISSSRSKSPPGEEEEDVDDDGVVVASVPSYGFFKLDFVTKIWTHKLRMPPAISHTFAYVGSCVASGNQFLCVTGSTPFKETVVAMYDRAQRAWGWLPSCPLKASSLGNRVEFAFQPNVHAIP